MVTATGPDPGFSMVRNGKNPGSVEPSAKAHDGSSDVAPTTSWPSLISGPPAARTRWKYSGLSATIPPGADVVTWMDTPLDTGSDTSRPRPAGSALSKMRTVRREPGATVAVAERVVPSPSR